MYIQYTYLNYAGAGKNLISLEPAQNIWGYRRTHIYTVLYTSIDFPKIYHIYYIRSKKDSNRV